MSSGNKFVAAAVVGLLSSGCIVVPTYQTNPSPPPPAPEAAVVAGPVIEAPGVALIDVEPPPEARVYVYDPGFPPGVYFYDNFYWYGGYRYPHDVFIDRFVNVNVRENRYINREDNRRLGQQIEARHREEFARTHGVREGGRPEEHRDHE